MILIICLYFSPEEETLWTRRRFYVKQRIPVRVAGQAMDRYSDTKPEPTVIFVIVTLAVKKYLMKYLPGIQYICIQKIFFACSAGFYILLHGPT